MVTKCKVDFGSVLREWDGFGINYVAAAQTRDYSKWPQDYGSFELLNEDDRQQIVEMIFGDDGLKPSIGKMFIDSLQAGMEKPENLNTDPYILDMNLYDHETTTKWMKYFMREGLKRIKTRGEEFKLVCTLYGPAPWMTKQKIVRGRDLDQEMKYEVAKYIIAFAKYMREHEGLPIKYISLHNEGGIEEMRRWPEDGTDAPEYAKHDYNGIWPTEQVVDFIRFMKDMLNRFGLEDVGLGNGECTRLQGTTKYAKTIVEDEEACNNYGLMTSHGFGNDDGAFTSEPIDIIREKKPEIHGWVTSASWGKMDITFLTTIHRHIYESKINGYIPWAAVQRHSQWVGGDPNPGTAFLITEEGKWSVQRGYYLYKHYCPVGRNGMGVASTESECADIMISAFAANGTENPDGFVIINKGNEEKELVIEVANSKYVTFSCVLTSNDKTYEKGESMAVRNGSVTLTVPPQAVVTLQGI
jgi:O-glycosyl hydrolase